MRIRWHGHSCFEFEDSRNRVVIDPHDGKSIGIKPPSVTADIVLMSHDHYDHNVARIVKGIHKDFLGRTGRFSVNGLEIEGLPAFHDEEGGAARGQDTMYMFKMDGMRVCHCGDLGCIPSPEVIEKIRGVDFLFVPVGEVFTLPLPKVKELIELVNPTVVVPMHYRVGGLTIPVSNIDGFLEMIPQDAVDYIGNEIEVSREDIGENKECWVFERRAQ
jgi:L-ascorbate metabolism protein UlaG (beta-lactamase superfamily)